MTMQCSQCQHENRSAASFCEECGTPLARVCGNCGHDARAGAKFCEACGRELAAPRSSSPPLPEPRSYTPKHLIEKILTSASALEGERKLVTVLFADVKGSMELAERLDPEEWHQIMNRFFAILSDGVHRFEGTVNQYTGDGIMALFGAPIAHEDHAQRACYAALYLNDELGRYAQELKRERELTFSVRMGLNSGEVVVGAIGDNLRMDYTALGHTVGLAQRMEHIADPGTVYLTEHTAALVSGFFRLRDLGQFELKGNHAALCVYELEGVGPLRTRLDVSQARGFSRFVGRSVELQTLETVMTRTAAGDAAAVGVVGEAGVGKSRLCYEFIQRCRARGITVYEAHGVAYGKAVPLQPVLEFVRGYFGITDHDAERVARDKVAGRLLQVDDSFREALPILFDFLGIPDPERPAPRMEPEAQQQYLFSLAKRLVHVRSQREPAVLLFEDLHWFDAVSEAFVETLADALPGTRTLMLVNFRPEYNAGWMRHSYYQRLPLRALGSEAIRELLDELLGSDPSLANLAERIQTHSGGNPFFIEEIVQSLVEAGSLQGTKADYRLVEPVERITLPGTVQALLTARIDRLSAPDKHVLQAAAVVGKTFSGPVLTRAVEDAQLPVDKSLRSLLRAEFIYQDALYPHAQYPFKHPLTHEVAYHAQLAEQRARLHAAVAQAVIELDPSRLDEQAALLAHHWQQAGEALEAARWSRRAAEWVGLRDVREASRHWRAVRTLLEDVPESEEKTALRVAACVGTLECGWRVGLTEHDAATVFEEGKRAAEQCGDVLALTRLLNVYGVIRGLAGEVEEYLAHAAEGLQLARQTADPALILLGQVTFVYAHYIAGKMREALAVTERAIEEAPEDPRLGTGPLEFSPYLWLVMFRGVVLVSLGRLREARDQLDRAMQLAREYGEYEIVGWIHINYSSLARLCGDIAGTVDHARRAVEVAEKTYTPFSRMLAYNTLGSAYVASSDWEGAVRACQISLEIAQQSRTGLFAEGYVLASLAEAYAGRGDEQLAQATAEKAVAATQERRTRLFECIAHIAFARVLLKCDARRWQQKIEQALTQAQTLVEETGARSYEPSIRIERAELARLVGDEAGQQRELSEAQRLFAEIGATGYTEQPAEELR